VQPKQKALQPTALLRYTFTVDAGSARVLVDQAAFPQGPEDHRHALKNARSFY